jgi:hypothetical protein
LTFEPGSLASFVLPEIANSYRVLEQDQEEFVVCLLKQATREDKERWFVQRNLTPNTNFFSQKLWLALHEDDILLVLQGFLEPLEQTEEEE